MSIYYLLNICLLVLFSLPGAVNHSSLYLTFSTETGKFHIFSSLQDNTRGKCPWPLEEALLRQMGLCFSSWVSVSDRNAVREPL